MKTFILSAGILLLSASIASGQKYMTRTGQIYFSAIVPGTPEVEATNNEVANILDTRTGELIFQVPVKSFKFKRALMQQHFNENYMESDKYPKAEFTGKIANIGDANFTKDGTYNITTAGKLTIHGVSHDITVPGTATVKGNTVTLKGKFTVNVSDYNITVPSIVAYKVAKQATIVINSDLTQK